MIELLEWESLEAWTAKHQLTMLLKIIRDLVDIPSSEYLTPASNIYLLYFLKQHPLLLLIKFNHTGGYYTNLITMGYEGPPTSGSAHGSLGAVNK